MNKSYVIVSRGSTHITFMLQCPLGTHPTYQGETACILTCHERSRILGLHLDSSKSVCLQKQMHVKSWYVKQLLDSLLNQGKGEFISLWFKYANVELTSMYLFYCIKSQM